MHIQSRNTLRKITLARRDSLLPVNRIEKSACVVEKLFSLEEVKCASVIFVYMHFRSEVQTLELIKQCIGAGKVITIPFTILTESRLLAVRIKDLERDVEPGYCTIPEPKASLVHDFVVDPSGIDVVVLPGSVFDKSGGRLGYGGGFYDRFLVWDAPQAVRVGLAFELQITEKVPVEPHDQLMDYTVTEENVYDCRRVGHAKNSRLP